MPDLLLGVDVGTASTKGVLVTLGGEAVAEHVVGVRAAREIDESNAELGEAARELVHGLAREGAASGAEGGSTSM